MGILIALVPLILVVVGFVWGFWLILRKGEMVAQPAKMIGYFGRVTHFGDCSLSDCDYRPGVGKSIPGPGHQIV